MTDPDFKPGASQGAGSERAEVRLSATQRVENGWLDLAETAPTHGLIGLLKATSQGHWVVQHDCRARVGDQPNTDKLG